MRVLPKLLMVALSLCVTLLLGEVGVRVAFRRSMDFDMEFWKYATQVKLPSKNPRLGHVHRPATQAFLMGVPVATNGFGLRGPETTLAKPAGTYRVVAIGDSLTFGWGVAQEETFVAQLERMLNASPPPALPPGVRFEVLNLGVGNYNTVQEVESLKTIGLRLDPDLVLVGHYINDAEPVSDREGGVLEHSFLAAYVASRVRRLAIGGSRLGSYSDYYRSLYSEHQPGFQAMHAALAELGRLRRERRIPVVLYLLPDLHDLSATYPFLDINRSLTRTAAELGLPVVDLLPDFAGVTPESTLWVSHEDAHPNAGAHARIARAIHRSLAAGITSP